MGATVKKAVWHSNRLPRFPKANLNVYSKRFVLPLAHLKAREKPSNNDQLLDDYAVWFVNGRR